MAKQLLDGPDIIALFQEMGGKAVTEGVDRGVGGDIGRPYRLLELAL